MNAGVVWRAIVLCAVLLSAPGAAGAQQAAGVELPMPSLMTIANDFDEGRNPMYCYFGRRFTAPVLLIKVDSVTVVETPSACRGIGIAFVTRIADPLFLAQVLQGLIQSNGQFVVASAFYRTEDIEHDGERIHAARALSVVRGIEALARRSGQ